MHNKQIECSDCNRSTEMHFDFVFHPGSPLLVLWSIATIGMIMNKMWLLSVFVEDWTGRRCWHNIGEIIETGNEQNELFFIFPWTSKIGFLCLLTRGYAVMALASSNYQMQNFGFELEIVSKSNQFRKAQWLGTSIRLLIKFIYVEYYSWERVKNRSTSRCAR